MKLVSKSITFALAAALAIGISGCSVPTNVGNLDNQGNSDQSNSDQGGQGNQGSADGTNQGNQGSTDGSNQGSSNGSDQGETSEALKKYADAERATIVQVHEMYPGVYEDITVETQGSGTIIFKYKYATDLDIQQTAAELEKLSGTFESSSYNDVFPAMISFGVKGPKTITYIYYNVDGTLIYEKSIDSK